MEEKVRRYIDQFHMLRAGDTVVAGVSGGADSVCLLLLLDGMREQIGFLLQAVHVEHGIRGEESRADARFTAQLARSLDIPLQTFCVDAPRYREETGCSLEEAARDLRYDCFRKACEAAGTDRLALAHNADDCAETMLFHLARGTGIRGLCGIRPVSERDGLIILRPLLCVTREEIEAWLAARGQESRTDSTNGDLSYARNKIRACVLPPLREINAQAVPHMQQLAGQLAQLDDYLDEAAWEAGRGTFDIETDAPALTISCTAFSDLPPILQQHLLLQLLALAAGSRKDLTALHVEKVLQLMEAQVGAQVSLPGRITAEKTYGAVVLRKETFAAAPRQEWDLKIPGETVTEDGLRFSAEILDRADFSQKIPQKSYTKWFDYDRIKSAVRLRGRRQGDYLQTDAAGGHQKLKKFLIDEKVPLSQRDGICLLADGDHIMWVVGFRISEAYKVTAQTKRVLRVTLMDTDKIGGGEETDG